MSPLIRFLNSVILFFHSQVTSWSYCIISFSTSFLHLIIKYCNIFILITLLSMSDNKNIWISLGSVSTIYYFPLVICQFFSYVCLIIFVWVLNIDTQWCQWFEALPFISANSFRRKSSLDYKPTSLGFHFFSNSRIASSYCIDIVLLMLSKTYFKKYFVKFV